MNVLQLICPTGFYGAERWILALARHATETGFRCDLAVTSEPPHDPIELLDRYPVSAGKRHCVKMRHRFDPRVLTELAELVRRRDIDVIHTHGYKSDSIGLLVARRTGTRIVATAHGYTRVTSPKDRLYHLIGNACLRRADRVVPLSSELMREVHSRGVNPARVKLIGNGVDTEEIDEFRIQLNGSVATNVSGRVGYVGQLVKRKRVDLTIRAFNHLWRKDETRRLHLLGAGPERPALESLVSNLPCAKAITFHGFVKERLQAMAAFDLMLMTSEAEGVPRTLMEAMALGVPCAAFAIPGIDELIENGHSGLLAPDGDLAELCRCSERILGNPLEARHLAENARARILDQFSARNMAERYAALFHDVVARDDSVTTIASTRSKGLDDVR